MCHKVLVGIILGIARRNGSLPRENIELEWKPWKPFSSAFETHPRFVFADAAVDDRVGGDVVWFIPPKEVNATGTDAMNERVEL